MTDPEIATIYHNPRCSKSRAALALLQQKEMQVTTIDYLNTPIDRDILLTLLEQLQLTPRELLRRGESVYKDLNLADTSLTDEQLIEAMTENPILIERPIVSFRGRAAIGRPIDHIIDLLDS